MSSVKSVLVPSYLNGTFLHALINDIRVERSGISSILLDWTNCERVDSLALCLLLNLQNECAELDLKIFHAPAEGSAFFQSAIDPIINFPRSSLDLMEFGSGAFLTAIKDLDKAVARAELMKKYFVNHPALKIRDTGSLEIIFAELYMNVCQHSSGSAGENGVAMLTFHEDSESLELIISDVGVGIPSNIKEVFEEYIDRPDEEAIEFSTGSWITTQSTAQNYGQGLSTARSSVLSMKGILEIYSGMGYWGISEEGQTQSSLDTYHNGTQIIIRIDLRNFETRDASSFSEEINF